MPILDQGYQHWKGTLRGHSWRWLAITRQGIRAQLRNRWVWAVLAFACFPAILLSGFLMLWGLFEQKSSLLAPLFLLLQNLPDELRAGPRGFRTTFWTLAFNVFLDVQLFFAMLLVLLVGPELISQDLRFNAIPLYLSRPVRRLDYFAGKLGVIGAYLGAVMIVPVLLGYALGIAFSLDPRVFLDTWRVLVAGLAYGLIVAVSAGTLMLAFSSLTRNARFVGALWIGVWVLSQVAAGQLQRTINQEWCPLLSYTGNLTRVRDALLDSEAQWKKLSSLFQTGKEQVKEVALGRGPQSRSRPRITFGWNRPAPPRPPRPPEPATLAPDPTDDLFATYPWQWSAGVLAGLAVFSLWILATRVRSLDRLR